MKHNVLSLISFSTSVRVEQCKVQSLAYYPESSRDTWCEKPIPKHCHWTKHLAAGVMLRFKKHQFSKTFLLAMSVSYYHIEKCKRKDSLGIMAGQRLHHH